MTSYEDDLRAARGIWTGTIFGAALWAAVGGWLLPGCTSTGAPTPQAQKVINVLCKGDATAQPIVVQVATIAAPATGAAAPAVAVGAALDQVLVHPAVVAACARYGTQPATVVPAVPAGATTVPVTIVTPVAS